MIIVTGGAGFIGSNFILNWLDTEKERVLNLDKLTYAGNLENLKKVENNPLYTFVKGDICDINLISDIFNQHKPHAIVHFAAESHVDRSISGPAEFIRTNIAGTFSILEVSRCYWQSLDGEEKDNFRFLHVSTDEVYGSLDVNDSPFKETNPYEPNSPYSASKASSDHLVRSWHHTYGLPTLTTNCSNNYGPYQFPEKLIPLTILNALNGNPITIYGDGKNIRDWLYVIDHCKGIKAVLQNGKVGETYNIGGWNEIQNIDIVTKICDILDSLKPRDKGSYKDLITFIQDRPGHDRRYAIDAQKIEKNLGWKPEETFETGILKTVQWYLDNQWWINHIQDGSYQKG